MTIFELTERNMETNGHDAYAYFRQQMSNAFFAPTQYIVTESASGDEVINEPETIAQPPAKRTYTPEQQARRNEQRRLRRSQGKAN